MEPRRLTDREKRFGWLMAVATFILGDVVFYATGVISGFASAFASGAFLGVMGFLVGVGIARVGRVNRSQNALKMPKLTAQKVPKTK